ncbi:MAG: fluoride efflux transporter CrcB [Desulfobulbus propionicus]|nr:MAG: fluoride efflux transporter CrcB [Desulfobulbus propionicus]
MPELVRLVSIGAGGCCGALLRYLLSGWIQGKSPSPFFPLGTMGVNMIGCFLIGLMTMLVETRAMFSTEMRSFIFIGLLGAFTTFSTFGSETFYLLRDGRFGFAVLNSVSQVIVGLLMVWLGRIIAVIIWR